jgi:hypothetical protein
VPLLTRRELLKTGLAAVPGAGFSPFEKFQAPTGAAYAGFPVPSRQWRGDSSVAAALKSGELPAGSALRAVAQSQARPQPATYLDFHGGTLVPDIPEDFSRLRSAQDIAALRARFPDLRRHFVFDYYAWYGTKPYVHWEERGYASPFGVASSMMPALGPYDSMDASVVERHARWIADAGVGAIALSWWGRDSRSNLATPMIMDVMRAHDIHVTFHLEPYRPDRALFYASDINYLLREYGERRRWDGFLLLDHGEGPPAPVFKTLRTIVPCTVVDCLGLVQAVPDYTPDDVWMRQTDTNRENVRPLFDDVVLLADSLDVIRTAAGGFDGIAIYDSFVRPATWPKAAKECGDKKLLYSFAVNCGFDAYVPVIPAGVCDVPSPVRPPVGAIDWLSPAWRQAAEMASRDRVIESLTATIDVQVDPRLGNAKRGFFLTYLNTFNEWHEGTAFEPAKHRANLLPEERPFNYHNPDNCAWRLELLQALLDPITSGRSIGAPDQASGLADRGESPVWHGDGRGATSENTACIRPRSNAVREDASLVECSGTFTTGC